MTIGIKLTTSFNKMKNTIASGELHPLVQRPLRPCCSSTPNTMQWNNELKKWLKEIPDEYNVPILWDLFLQELKIKAKDVQQTNALIKLDNLKMEELKIKPYINEFEKLAEQAGLTTTNPDTMYLFIKGLTTSIQNNICKKPIYGYCMA